MYKLLYLFVLSLSFTANCQIKNSSEIVSEGKSKIKQRPDVAVFTLTVEKTDTIENNVIEKLNSEVAKLVSVFTKMGFNNKSIKISDLDISSSSRYGDDSQPKRYTASNILTTEFKLDTKTIDAFYAEIQKANINDLDINFETRLSDSLERAVRIRLVQGAIEDARLNAINISKTLKVKLGKVKKVSKFTESYRIEEIKEDQIISTKSVPSDPTYQTSFAKYEIEEKEIEEQITVTYSIE